MHVLRPNRCPLLLSLNKTLNDTWSLCFHLTRWLLLYYLNFFLKVAFAFNLQLIFHLGRRESWQVEPPGGICNKLIENVHMISTSVKMNLLKKKKNRTEYESALQKWKQVNIILLKKSYKPARENANKEQETLCYTCIYWQKANFDEFTSCRTKLRS